MSTENLEDLSSQLLLERKKVDVANHDFSVRELVRMLLEGELNIAPAYQRKYRWSTQVASTFIESVLLGLPIPPIFVATNADFQWEVVDGLQRLSTLAYFVGPTDDMHFLKREGALRLAGLAKLTQLEGIAYSDLTVDLQRYFGRQPLQIISLTDKSDSNVRFDLFERLNSGAIALTPQEVRSCIYRGRFNEFIEELAETPELDALLKLQELNKADGTKAEQVLKFFAYKDVRATYDGRVKSMLNGYMEQRSSRDVESSKERDIFTRSVKHLHKACDEGPFKRANTNITPLVQFEACLNGIAQIFESGSTPIIPEPGWIEDEVLVEASTKGSNTPSKFRTRNRRAREIFAGSVAA